MPKPHYACFVFFISGINLEFHVTCLQSYVAQNWLLENKFQREIRLRFSERSKL